MTRSEMLSRMRAHRGPWDMIVVGGGATGVGVAIDAASRGYDVLLLERSDFGKGTSSRSTKLAHGGVRYLQQGDIALVREALQERGLMLQNAPHLVHDLAFIVPNFGWWEAPVYGMGLKLYQLLAGKYSFGKSRLLSREETITALPTIKTEGLRGGAIYYDGQFDDARLLIHMVFTAFEQGATLLNYVEVTGFSKSVTGQIDGILARDVETGDELNLPAKIAINATGAFSDHLRQLADPSATPNIAPSQGVHVVLKSDFLPGANALMVPHTSDGRVLFAIPWHGHVLVGTTDTPVSAATAEPLATQAEIEFLLSTAGHYLTKAPTRRDVLSVFAGIRPLVQSDGAENSADLSRDHLIRSDNPGLITVSGGKWTTYRRIAEDCVDQAVAVAHLPERPCLTRELKLHGFDTSARNSLSVYGSDAAEIRHLIANDPALGETLHPELPYLRAEVIWAVRQEMARTVEDVLARRTRALFLNARAAMEMTPVVADLMAAELSWDAAMKHKQLSAFGQTAANYLLPC